MQVAILKPFTSSPASPEQFIVCKGFNGCQAIVCEVWSIYYIIYMHNYIYMYMHWSKNGLRTIRSISMGKNKELECVTSMPITKKLKWLTIFDHTHNAWIHCPCQVQRNEIKMQTNWSWYSRSCCNLRRRVAEDFCGIFWNILDWTYMYTNVFWSVN